MCVVAETNFNPPTHGDETTARNAKPKFDAEAASTILRATEYQLGFD